MGKSVTISQRLPPRSAAAISRCFRRRSQAATAISNSSSAPTVAERLVIDHVGHRGDGVSLAGGGSLFVPYALAAETVEAVEVAGHPERRQLTKVEQASPERIE